MEESAAASATGQAEAPAPTARAAAPAVSARARKPVAATTMRVPSSPRAAVVGSPRVKATAGEPRPYGIVQCNVHVSRSFRHTWAGGTRGALSRTLLGALLSTATHFKSERNIQALDLRAALHARCHDVVCRSQAQGSNAIAEGPSGGPGGARDLTRGCSTARGGACSARARADRSEGQPIAAAGGHENARRRQGRRQGLCRWGGRDCTAAYACAHGVQATHSWSGWPCARGD